MMKKKILATMVLGLGITLAQSAMAQNTNSVLAKIKQTYPNFYKKKAKTLITHDNGKYFLFTFSALKRICFFFFYIT